MQATKYLKDDGDEALGMIRDIPTSQRMSSGKEGSMSREPRFSRPFARAENTVSLATWGFLSEGDME